MKCDFMQRCPTLLIDCFLLQISDACYSVKHPDYQTEISTHSQLNHIK